MSRTDGHAPYWTWATWYEPCHSYYCVNYISRSWQKVSKQPCDLPERPVRNAGRYKLRLVPQTCTWEPVWPPKYSETLKLYGRRNAPRWFRRHVWEGPERTRQRATLGEMAKEYNATGELDDGDFPNYQHRHGAIWDWH
jgi:hypothetical protein